MQLFRSNSTLAARCLLEFSALPQYLVPFYLWSGLCSGGGWVCLRWVSPNGSSVPKRDFIWNLAYALNIQLSFIPSTYLKVVFLIFSFNINSSAIENCIVMQFILQVLQYKVFHNCVCNLLRGGWFSIFIKGSEFFESQRCFCITAVKELCLLVQYLSSFKLMSLSRLWNTQCLFHDFVCAVSSAECVLLNPFLDVNKFHC